VPTGKYVITEVWAERSASETSPVDRPRCPYQNFKFPTFVVFVIQILIFFCRMLETVIRDRAVL